MTDSSVLTVAATPSADKEPVTVMETQIKTSPADGNSQCQHEDADVLRTEAWVEHDNHQFYTVTYEVK